MPVTMPLPTHPYEVRLCSGQFALCLSRVYLCSLLNHLALRTHTHARTHCCVQISALSMGSSEKDTELVQQLCAQEQGPLLGTDLRRIIAKEAAQLTVRSLDHSLPHRPPCLPVD
eukprot:COSAG05_NODE_1946_length_3797_cov_2.430233_4_plen_115_part_00